MRSRWPAVALLVLAACGDDPRRSSSNTATSSPADTLVEHEPNTTAPASTATPVPDAQPSLPPPPDTIEEATVPSTSPNPPIGDGPPVVADAVDDLRSRLGSPEIPVEVVSVEQVAWSDGSVGCPQPGRDYTQALVDGVRIVLRADGVEYAYHQGGNAPVFYCPPERAKPPAPGGRTDI